MLHEVGKDNTGRHRVSHSAAAFHPTMPPRARDPLNAVQLDQFRRAAIEAENRARYGEKSTTMLYGFVETEQDDWKPGKKLFNKYDCYELPKYPRPPRSQRDPAQEQ